MCCLLTRFSFLLAGFFAMLLVGRIISGTDSGLALVGLFSAVPLLVFLWRLSQIF